MSLRKAIAVFIISLFLNNISTAQTASDSTATIYTKVDEGASYSDGNDGWRKFLIKNMNASVPLDNGAPIGRFTAIAQFVVHVNGTVSNITPVSTAGYGTEDEVVRLIKISGLWKPALVNGKPVASYVKQPITFLNEIDGINVKTEKAYTLFAGADNNVIITVRRLASRYLRIVAPDDPNVTLTVAGNGNFIIHPINSGALMVDIYDKTTLVTKVRFEVK